MKILRIIIPTFLLLAFLTGSAFAQSKMATVNMDKVLKGYYKTKLAEDAIQERSAQLDKDDRAMKDDFKKGSDEYQKLLEQANDQAISDDERDKRKQAADAKLKQLQDSKNAIDQYERQAQVTLSEQKQRMEQNLFKDVQKAVSDKAKAGGYNLVINTSIETIVLYAGNDNDLTDDVLKQLNAGAPVDVTKPAAGATIPPPLGQ
jgi:outer membrane protein